MTPHKEQSSKTLYSESMQRVRWSCRERARSVRKALSERCCPHSARGQTLGRSQLPTTSDLHSARQTQGSIYELLPETTVKEIERPAGEKNNRNNTGPTKLAECEIEVNHAPRRAVAEICGSNCSTLHSNKGQRLTVDSIRGYEAVIDRCRLH